MLAFVIPAFQRPTQEKTPFWLAPQTNAGQWQEKALLHPGSLNIEAHTGCVLGNVVGVAAMHREFFLSSHSRYMEGLYFPVCLKVGVRWHQRFNHGKVTDVISRWKHLRTSAYSSIFSLPPVVIFWFGGSIRLKHPGMLSQCVGEKFPGKPLRFWVCCDHSISYPRLDRGQAWRWHTFHPVHWPGQSWKAEK